MYPYYWNANFFSVDKFGEDSNALKCSLGVSHLFLPILNLQRMGTWHALLEWRRAHSLKIEKFHSSPPWVKNGHEEWIMENGPCLEDVWPTNNLYSSFSFSTYHKRGVTLSSWRMCPIGSSFLSFFKEVSFSEDVWQPLIHMSFLGLIHACHLEVEAFSRTWHNSEGKL